MFSGVKLSFKFGYGFFSVDYEVFVFVGFFNDKLVGFVCFGVFFRVGNYLFNFVVGEIGRRSNSYRLFMVGCFVNGRNVNDIVGVDVEGDLDLRNIFGCRRKVSELEVIEKFVVLN